jgi:hypothetical protein
MTGPEMLGDGAALGGGRRRQAALAVRSRGRRRRPGRGAHGVLEDGGQREVVREERRAWLGRAVHGRATETRRTRRALPEDDDLDGGGGMERMEHVSRQEAGRRGRGRRRRPGDLGDGAE